MTTPRMSLRRTLERDGKLVAPQPCDACGADAHVRVYFLLSVVIDLCDPCRIALHRMLSS